MLVKHEHLGFSNAKGRQRAYTKTCRPSSEKQQSVRWLDDKCVGAPSLAGKELKYLARGSQRRQQGSNVCSFLFIV